MAAATFWPSNKSFPIVVTFIKRPSSACTLHLMEFGFILRIWYRKIQSEIHSHEKWTLGFFSWYPYSGKIDGYSSISFLFKCRITSKPWGCLSVNQCGRLTTGRVMTIHHVCNMLSRWRVGSSPYQHKKQHEKKLPISRPYKGRKQ